ncbi:membrane protein [Clostridia bacterium]|nr:membrane protein [Clostridia bacterium]
MLARRTSRRKPRAQNSSYWMSYSDMMSALLLMFVLLLFLSFNRYVTMQKEKEDELAAKSAQLTAQEDQLSQAQQALLTREEELTAINYALNSQQLTMNQQQSELDQRNAELATSKDDLEQSLARLILQQNQIDEQERLLALSQEEIDNARAQLSAATQDLESREIQLSAKDAALLLEQLRVNDLQTLLNAQKDQLSQQSARIDELVGVRSRIITQLRDAFRTAGVNVTVDQSGAITMDSTVFFDTDRSTIRAEGRELLTRILPVYFRTLLRPENAEFVGEIIIEGHTDSDGTYEHNLDLSQRRAQIVATFCLSDSFTALTPAEKEQLRTILTANGRSETQLIYGANGQEDKAASRRVEIKFRMKDAEMLESMGRILSEGDH